MTDGQWQAELASAIEGTKWQVFSAHCAQDSSACLAQLENHATGKSEQVKLLRQTFPTREARRAEILLQLRQPRPGDRIIVAKQDGRFDVLHVIAVSQHEARRTNLAGELHTAYEIAQSGLEAEGTRVWICHEENPESFELYRVR